MTSRSRKAVLLLVSVVAAFLATTTVAHAAVTVSRAEMNGSRLRIEGRATANRTITVDGVAMGTSDGSGNFRVERDGFTAPADCTVDVNDGSATAATATLSGCTPTAAPSTTTTAPATTTTTAAAPTTTTTTAPAPTTTAAPATTTTAASGFRITTTALGNGNVGTDYTGYIEACCGGSGPYRWSLVAGRVPDGLQFAGDSLRLIQTTAVTGRPTTVQTTSFTVEARDGSGNTARRTFSITIDPPRPLVITNQSDTLAPGRVGVSYATGVFADGGIPPYRWSLVAGQLPPGLSLTTSPGRITGTPTTVGTFTFTLRVTDEGGQQASRQFSITISP
ncbi:MAG TPA: Ig domain-containing protein [Acidimicrobiales bacterium]|nr:Ig domain-containing protein [Acidimicrobiales bacterium]